MAQRDRRRRPLLRSRVLLLPHRPTRTQARDRRNAHQPDSRVGIASSYLFLNERLTSRQWIGAALIILAFATIAKLQSHTHPNHNVTLQCSRDRRAREAYADRTTAP